MRVKLLRLDLEISQFIRDFESLLGQPERWSDLEKGLIQKAVHYFMIHFWKAPLTSMRYLIDRRVLKGLLPELTEQEILSCTDHFLEHYQVPEGKISKRILTQVAMAVLFSKLLDLGPMRRDLILKSLEQFCHSIFWRLNQAGYKEVDTLFVRLLALFPSCPANKAMIAERIATFEQSGFGLPKEEMMGLRVWAHCLKSSSALALGSVPVVQPSVSSVFLASIGQGAQSASTTVQAEHWIPSN